MKAVVLEIKDGKAAVLRDDGTIELVTDLGYEVGMELTSDDSDKTVEEAQKTRKSRATIILSFRRYAGSIAAALAVVLITGGIGVYAMPYGTVSLDVNPSVEYTINYFGTVLSAEGVNEDGAKVLENAAAEGENGKLVGKSLTNAAQVTIGEIRAENYLAEDDNYVVIAANTASEAKSRRIVEKLESVIDAEEDLTAVTATVSDEELKKAHDYGLSAGKYKVLTMLGQAGEEEDEEVVERRKDASVNDIMEEYAKIVDGGAPADEGSVKPEDEGTTRPDDAGEQPAEEGTTRPEDAGEEPADAGIAQPEDSGGQPSGQGLTQPDDAGTTAPDGSGEIKPQTEGQTAPTENAESASETKDNGVAPEPEENGEGMP